MNGPGKVPRPGPTRTPPARTPLDGGAQDPIFPERYEVQVEGGESGSSERQPRTAAISSFEDEVARSRGVHVRYVVGR